MRLPRLLAVLPICALVVALSGCVVAYPALEGKFERTLNVSGPVDLEVNTGSGKIDVRAGSSSVVRIIGIIRANNDWRSNAQDKVRYLMANPPIEQTGDTIRIGRIENEAYRNNVSISYEITVPAETKATSHTGSGSQRIESVRGPIEASTGSGSIVISGIGGDVTAQTGSGSIELSHVSGKVEARTGSGSIRAEGIGGSIRANTGSGHITLEQTMAEAGGSRDVEAGTGSGGIEVSGVNGSLRAETGSGRITARGEPAGDWELDASSGSVTLNLDGNAGFDLYTRTSSGQIRVDLPITTSGTMSKHEVRGKVRGGGRLIEVRTGSGSITVR